MGEESSALINPGEPRCPRLYIYDVQKLTAEKMYLPGRHDSSDAPESVWHLLEYSFLDSAFLLCYYCFIFLNPIPLI